MTQDCEKCNGTGLLQVGNGMGCPDCKGTGKIVTLDASYTATPEVSVQEEKKSFFGKIFNK